MKNLQIEAKNSEIGKALDFLEEIFTAYSFDKKSVNSSLFLVEEILIGFIEKASEDAKIDLSVKGNKKKFSITVKAKGDKLDISDISLNRDFKLDDFNDDQQAVINSLILNANKERFKLKYQHGFNIASVSINKDENAGFKKIFRGIILGIIAGIILRLLNHETLNAFLSENVFSLVSQLFISCMQMVVAPLVFFSIAESMSKFEDYSSFGKVGLKVIVMYLLTTVIAIVFGTAVFYIFKPGNPAILPQVEKILGSYKAIEGVDISLKNTLINIVPSNFFGAFVNTDMLQIIFIAIIIGIAANTIGSHSKAVIGFIKAGNELFLKITSLVISLNHYVVFAIMANVVLTMSIESFVVLGRAAIAIIVGILCMMTFYLFMIKTFGKIPVKKFIEVYKETLIIAFSSCSSNATVPYSMKSLEKLRVSSKIYSFSLPLGATINMDGLCIFFIVTCLFFARIFSIEITLGMLLNLYLMITLVSVGIPAVTGAVYAVLSMLLVQIGVPAGAVVFIMPLITIVDFFITTNNVMGDSTVTIVVARSEKMIDDEIQK